MDRRQVELSVYWKKYPWEAVGVYLRGTRGYPLQRRELGVQWAGGHMERNRSYASIDELRLAVTGAGQGRAPSRMESGPFYPGAQRKGRKNKANELRPKGIGWDIDITDYLEDNPLYGPGHLDCLQNHTKKMGVCNACWATRLEPSRRVLEFLLREGLGMEHIIYVFSGNKGFHALCMDDTCLDMDDEMRRALFEFVVSPNNPELEYRAYTEVMLPLFNELFVEGPHALSDTWLSYGLSFQPQGHTVADKLAHVRQTIDHGGDTWNLYQRKLLRALFWPRVDMGPIKSDHLLKIPFCVHEKSCRVSLPLADPASFLPESAPTIMDVLEDRFSLEVAADHMVSVVERARYAARTQPAWDDTPIKLSLTINVNWAGRSSVDYVEALICAMRQYESAGVVAYVVPDAGWRCMFEAVLMHHTLTYRPAVIVPGTEAAAKELHADVYAVTHLQEGQSWEYADRFIRRVADGRPDPVSVLLFTATPTPEYAACSAQEIKDIVARAAWAHMKAASV